MVYGINIMVVNKNKYAADMSKEMHAEKGTDLVNELGKKLIII